MAYSHPVSAMNANNGSVSGALALDTSALGNKWPRRSVKRGGGGAGGASRFSPDSVFGGHSVVYIKLLLLWLAVFCADHVAEFRFEYLWPLYLFLRSVYDSFKYQGMAFSVFFICVVLTSDVVCYLFIPVHWLLFFASTYVWVQYVWQNERINGSQHHQHSNHHLAGGGGGGGASSSSPSSFSLQMALPTLLLSLLFVYIEAAIRLRELRGSLWVAGSAGADPASGQQSAAAAAAASRVAMPFQLDLCRPFAAHCIGYPVVTLGFGVKSYISYRMRRRRQRVVRRENEAQYEMLRGALPRGATRDAAFKSAVADEDDVAVHADGVSGCTASAGATSRRRSSDDDAAAATTSSSSSSTAISNANAHLLAGDYDAVVKLRRPHQSLVARVVDLLVQITRFAVVTIYRVCIRVLGTSVSWMVGGGKLGGAGNCFSDLMPLSDAQLTNANKRRPISAGCGDNGSGGGGGGPVSPCCCCTAMGHTSVDRRHSTESLASLTAIDNAGGGSGGGGSAATTSCCCCSGNGSGSGGSASAVGHAISSGGGGGGGNVSSGKGRGASKRGGGSDAAASASVSTLSSGGVASNNNSGGGKQDGGVQSAMSASSAAAVAGAMGGGSGGSVSASASSSVTNPPSQPTVNVGKLEADVKRYKVDLQISRNKENELRDQILTFMSGERHLKSELSGLQMEKLNLEKRVSELLASRSDDKSTIASLEKRVADERKQRVEFQQKLESEKRKSSKGREAALNERTAQQQQSRSELMKLEAEVRTLHHELQQARDRAIAAENAQAKDRRTRHKHGDPEALAATLTRLQADVKRLEQALAAEVKVKVDLFAALGEAKQQLNNRQSIIGRQEAEVGELKARIASVAAAANGGVSGGSIFNNGSVAATAVTSVTPPVASGGVSAAARRGVVNGVMPSSTTSAVPGGGGGGLGTLMSSAGSPLSCSLFLPHSTEFSSLAANLGGGAVDVDTIGRGVSGSGSVNGGSGSTSTKWPTSSSLASLASLSNGGGGGGGVDDQRHSLLHSPSVSNGGGLSSLFNGYVGGGMASSNGGRGVGGISAIDSAAAAGVASALLHAAATVSSPSASSAAGGSGGIVENGD